MAKLTEVLFMIHARLFCVSLFLLTFLACYNQNPQETESQTVMQHQTKRFKELDSILAKDPKYKVMFPGLSADEHRLGTGIAKSSWSDENYKKMNAHITKNIKTLEKKYPGRILFGFIGDYEFDKDSGDCDRSKLKDKNKRPGEQDDKSFAIHVWGANEGNFNYEEGTEGSWGGGQATCFEKQRPGVFGISTMPSDDKKALMADDKLIDKY